MTLSNGVRLRDALAAGALSGAVAGLAFATAHAFIIVPIWDRMWGSLLGAAFMGAVIAWSYVELRAPSGALFGLLLWLSVVPVTLADAVLRKLDVLPRLELLGVVIALALAVFVGGLSGWSRTRRLRGTIAGAAASLALTLIMGGPVPIGRSLWALGIFLAVLPVCVIGGVVLSGVVAWRPKPLSRE